MSWADVGQIATAAILSAGGIGAIIVGAVHFSVNQIADRLAKKYEAQLAQENQRYTSELSKREYVSKVRFDKEFELYQELSETQTTLVYDVGESVLFVRGMYEDNPKEARNFMDRFTADINKADISLKKYGCFIAKEIYEQYRTLDEIGQDVYKLSLFLFHATYTYEGVSSFTYKGQRYDTATAKREIECLQEKVSNLSDKIIDQIRGYLRSLDVI